MLRDESGRVLPLLLLGIIALAAVAFMGLGAFRAGPAPEITIQSSSPAIGKKTDVTATVAEPGRGLSRVRVEFVQGDRVEKLAEKSFSPRPSWSFWGSKTDRDRIVVQVGRDALKGLKAGNAVVRVTADRAGAWFRHPAAEVKELTLPVRITPPSLGVLSTATYVYQGGSEVVVYRVGDSCVRSGVKAGSWWFPGWPLPGGDKQARFALFAVPYDDATGSDVRLVASDDAGNEAEVSFVDKFFPRPPRSDTFNLKDEFVNKVVPAIMSQTPDLADKGSPVENFLQINGDLRKIDGNALMDLAARSKPEFLWHRPFEPLNNAQVMAHFADHRTYVYQGRTIDHQYHLGLDFAVTKAVPIPAANDGVVVLARYFGIFGNAVAIDHGYGLMSLYGHLSTIDVKEGQAVKRGEILGRSGDTGLAGGDHLHFSILLDGLPVNPIEWWDPHWLKDRIARKLGPAFGLQE